MWWIIGGIIITLIYGLTWTLCAMSGRCSRIEEAAQKGKTNYA